jgi:hypothetical protein
MIRQSRRPRVASRISVVTFEESLCKIVKAKAVSHLVGSGRAATRPSASCGSPLKHAPLLIDTPIAQASTTTRERPHEPSWRCVPQRRTSRSIEGGYSGRTTAGSVACSCTWRGCVLIAFPSHLPGTRRICSKQGGSSQGDGLFWQSAMKRNLTRRRTAAEASKRWTLTERRPAAR